VTPGTRPAVRLLTAAFLLRGVFFALALPYGDPLDEPFHLGYASFVAQTGRAPRADERSLSAEVLRSIVLLPRSTFFPGQRVTWRAWSSLSGSERSERRRQAFASQEADRKAFLAPNYEAQQAPLAYFAVWPALAALADAPLWERLLALRLLAVLVSACAVPLAFGFFRRVLARRAAAAATAAFVAFPGLGLFVGRFTNDALALPIVVAVLAILADMARGRLPRSRAAALGLLLAAGCWTKLYVLLLLPAAPLTALLFRRARRGPILRRAFAASAFAFLILLPWLVRQRNDTGDWLGLTETKQAWQLSIGVLDRVESLPEIANLRFGVVFARTFLWPGTWSASGAPAGLAIVLSLTLLAVAVPSRGAVASPRRRAAWLSAGLCVCLFLLGHAARDVTYAAVARAKGTTIAAGPDGWYLLVLLPAILAVGSAWGRGSPPRRFRAAALVFLAADWWLTMGVLPAVYAGWTEFNGANAPFAAYGPLLAAPWRAATAFAAVGLGGVGAAALAVLLVLWLLAFGLGLRGIRSFHA
jgi:hypothetical protein